MISLLVFLAVSCAPPKTSESIEPLGPPDPDVGRVLVVINEGSEEAVEVGSYYVKRRQIPQSNVLRLKLPSHYRFPEANFKKQIADPIYAKIKSLPKPIDFIVTTKGFPLAFEGEERRYSVDAWIMAMHKRTEPMPQEPLREDIVRNLNGYFSKNESFESKKYGMYLVTRLDGNTVDDCKRLVDHSLASKGENGPFVLDDDPTKPNERFSLLPDAMRRASEILKTKKLSVEYDATRTFLSPSGPVMGYVTWGSNDPSFDKQVYRGIRFKPGAIAETFVSWGARRLVFEEQGQSMITSLISQGVTGCKGYVSEPYTIALARPDILFDRYTSGFNLAESYYMASPLIQWKDVVIGDPLCKPYRKKQ